MIPIVAGMTPTQFNAAMNSNVADNAGNQTDIYNYLKSINGV